MKSNKHLDMANLRDKYLSQGLTLNNITLTDLNSLLDESITEEEFNRLKGITPTGLGELLDRYFQTLPKDTTETTSNNKTIKVLKLGEWVKNWIDITKPFKNKFGTFNNVPLSDQIATLGNVGGASKEVKDISFDYSNLNGNDLATKEDHIKTYVNHALSWQPVNEQKVKECIDFVWSLLKYPAPRIFRTASPLEAQKLANKLIREEKGIPHENAKDEFQAFGTFLTIYWQSFYAYYDLAIKLGMFKQEDRPEYFEIRKFLEAGIYAGIEYETTYIYCEKPTYAEWNDSGLHCTTGPAIEWADGFREFFINGRRIDKKLAESVMNGTYTRQQFLKEDNDEFRSAVYMYMGDKILDFLGAEEVDRRMFTHSLGEVEEMILYRTTENLNTVQGRNEPYAWLKRTCPSTGTNYLTPTKPEFQTVAEAAKFHRPSFVLMDVDYDWKVGRS